MSQSCLLANKTAMKSLKFNAKILKHLY